MSRQHAFITGGSSGIGLACARQLAARGYHLSLMARRADVLEEARAQLQPLCVDEQQRIVCVTGDVGVQGQMAAAVAQAVEACGPLHLLITSAGVVTPGYVEDLPDSAYEDTMRINYLGSVYAVRAALPHLRETAGRILLVASGAGLIGLFGYTSYCPSKFALRGFAEALHAELRHTRVGVSIVYPPDTDTPQLVQENLIKPLETRMMTESAGIWSADAVAKLMLKGVDAGKFAITPGADLTLLHRLGGVVTPVVQWIWAWKVRRMRA